MNNDTPVVMPIEEACLYLRIPKSTLYKIVQKGKIPCQKVERHWRFHRDYLDRWLQANSYSERFSTAKHEQELTNHDGSN